jgi:hypothetical protein
MRDLDGSGVWGVGGMLPVRIYNYAAATKLRSLNAFATRLKFYELCMKMDVYKPSEVASIMDGGRGASDHTAAPDTASDAELKRLICPAMF